MCRNESVCACRKGGGQRPEQVREAPLHLRPQGAGALAPRGGLCFPNRGHEAPECVSLPTQRHMGQLGCAPLLEGLPGSPPVPRPLCPVQEGHPRCGGTQGVTAPHPRSLSQISSPSRPPAAKLASLLRHPLRGRTTPLHMTVTASNWTCLPARGTGPRRPGSGPGSRCRKGLWTDGPGSEVAGPWP